MINYRNWHSHAKSVGSIMLSLTKPSTISRMCTSIVKTMSIFFLSLLVSVALPISITISSNCSLSCCNNCRKMMFFIHLLGIFLLIICTFYLLHRMFLSLGYQLENILCFCGPPYLIRRDNHHSLKFEQPFCSWSY